MTFSRPFRDLILGSQVRSLGSSSRSKSASSPLQGCRKVLGANPSPGLTPLFVAGVGLDNVEVLEDPRGQPR